MSVERSREGSISFSGLPVHHSKRSSIDHRDSHHNDRSVEIIRDIDRDASFELYPERDANNINYRRDLFKPKEEPKRDGNTGTVSYEWAEEENGIQMTQNSGSAKKALSNISTSPTKLKYTWRFLPVLSY